MKVLLLGCSSIAERRGLPALRSLDRIAAVDAASRRGRATAAAFTIDGTAFDTPEAALAGSDAALVYISTENGDHALWADRALASGRHVIVDKPAFDDLPTTRRIADAAVAAGLVVAEATVFLDHPRLTALDALFAETGRPTRVQACFSFPPLPAGNFRYDPARGGGAINDLGPYAAATCRWFFGDEPDTLEARILERGEVETAFTVTAAFADGRCFSGHYGFTTEYQNWVSAAGPGIAVRLDRFCTPPPDARLPIEGRRANADIAVDSPAGDCFAAMFARAIDAIDAATDNDDDGGATALRNAMLADAAFRDRIREGVR